MNWIFKAFVQKTISFFPLSHRLNYLLQRCFTVGRELPESIVLDRLAHAKNHLQSFEIQRNLSIDEADIWEIGTGWYPIVPIACYLAGAQSIVTTDVRKLYTNASVNQTIRALLRLHDEDRLSDMIPNIQSSRVDILRTILGENTIDKKFKHMNISVIVDDSNAYQIPSASKNLIISNNTLQFFHVDHLPLLFSEFRRIAKPGAVFSIAIDLTDEFAHADSTISQFNFLKFSKWQWQMITCHLNATNRLRFSDYRRFFQAFDQVNEKSTFSQPSDLANFYIHPSFSHYSQSDLLTKHVHFTAIRP